MDRPIAVPPRRGFFGRIAGAAALGAAGFAAATGGARAVNEDGPNWPGELKGRHKQVTDAVRINDGYPLYYTMAYLGPNRGTATAVVIVRHEAVPLALNHAMWEKYKIGEALHVTDPATKAVAVRNPFLMPPQGALRNDGAAIDKMLAAGVIFGACNFALRALSASLAPRAGVTPEAAAEEWVANIIPGISVIPSGTWGVNRAQEAGCTYCVGG